MTKEKTETIEFTGRIRKLEYVVNNGNVFISKTKLQQQIIVNGKIDWIDITDIQYIPRKEVYIGFDGKTIGKTIGEATIKPIEK